MNKFIGILLVAGGVFLLVRGLEARDSLGARMGGLFSESPRNKVTLLLVGGGSSVVGGALIILLSGKSR